MSATPNMGPGTELKRAVTIAHKLLDDLVASDMAALGLSIGEADLLTVVLVAEAPPAPTEIADWLSLTTAGVAGRLNTMERKGLIERRPHETDGRRLTVHLSERGRQLAGDVWDTKDRALIERVVDKMGEDRTSELVQELNRLIEVASEARGDAVVASSVGRTR